MEMRNLSYQKLSETVTHTQVRAPHTRHRTVGWRRCLRLVSEWYLLFLYALFCVAFAFSMWKGLHGKSFAVSGRSLRLDKSFRLTQTDVSTIISACLVAGRAIGTAWQALAAWRCIFILFEKTGLSLADANVVGSFKLPPWSIIRPRSSSRTGASTTKIFAVLSLLLAWPAQFSSPLATGSVSWMPITSYDNNLGKSIPIRSALPGRGWAMYKNGYNIRESLVARAAGLTTLKAVAPFEYNNGSLDVVPARRMAKTLSSYPNGTIVQNAKVPIFIVESLEWITDESQIPSKILRAVQDPKSGYLNFSQDEMQMTNAIGATALLKEEPWKVPSTDTLPEAIEVLHKVRYASTYVFSGGSQADYDCHKSIGYTNNTEFGPLPPGIHLVKSRRPDRSDCMAVAKLRISAGVTHCIPIGSTSPSSSCIIASNIMISKSSNVFPDNLTGEAFAMMQEVHAVVASLNMNDPESYVGKLDQALRESLIQTYQGTWSALTEYFSVESSSDTNGELEATGWEPVQALQAEVSPLRILLWLATSMLLVLSGLLVVALDSCSEGKTVVDPVIEAILLDSSGVILADDSRHDATDDGKAHGVTRKRLRLEVSNGSGVEGGYYHARLVPERMPLK